MSSVLSSLLFQLNLNVAVTPTMQMVTRRSLEKEETWVLHNQVDQSNFSISIPPAGLSLQRAAPQLAQLSKP